MFGCAIHALKTFQHNHDNRKKNRYLVKKLFLICLEKVSDIIEVQRLLS